jgi:hypothetical protein
MFCYLSFGFSLLDLKLMLLFSFGINSLSFSPLFYLWKTDFGLTLVDV